MEYFTTVHNLHKQSASQPNKVFLHQPIDRQWKSFTWLEVERQARTIATGLQAQGYNRGDRIGIISKNCAEWFIVDLAISMAGLVSVPIYATAGRKTIELIIEHSDIKAMFVGKLDDLQAASAAIAPQILRIAFPYPTIDAKAHWTDWLETYSPLRDIYLPALDDIASIVYTSGTTGTPKGIVLRHKNWAAAVQSTAIQLELVADDRLMSYLPLAHITERSVIEGTALYMGCQVFFVESQETFIDDVRHASPTAFVSVPRLWSKFQSQILTKVSQAKLNRLLKVPLLGKLVAYKIRQALGLHKADRFGSGTAPISVELLKWYHRLGISISEGWGMSETSGLSCANAPFSVELLGTIGRPLPCVEMKLSDRNEILVRGDAVFSEYYRNADETKASFVDGWFRTGDCAELDDIGVYRINGRIKEQFKTSKGKYVVPVPIESRLYSNHNIEQVCVVGAGIKQPVALVVLGQANVKDKRLEEKTLTATLNAVNESLEKHEKLDCILVCSQPWTIENELLTPTLKIKRNVLESKYEKILQSNLEGPVVWEADLSS